MMPPEIVGVKMEADRVYDAANIMLSLQVKIRFLGIYIKSIYLGNIDSPHFLTVVE